MVKRYGILIVCTAILFLGLVGTASAKTWYVDDDGGADFIRIQAAINAASAGDMIIVRDGTYTENVDVYKRLTIQSENVLDLTFVRAEDPAYSTFKVTSDYVNISGFTVEGAYHIAGIYLDYADYCNISNNNCSNNKYDGITLRDSNDNHISNNTCSSNAYNGISLLNSNDNSISNNICLNNNIAFLLVNSNENYISSNDCSNNMWAGIYLSESNDNSISNDICLNNDIGIPLFNSKGNSISNNTCSNNSAFGISLVENSSNNTLTNNNVNSNTAGIYLLNYSSNNTLTNNNVNLNTGGGINLHSSSKNILLQNNISNNMFGIFLNYSNNNLISVNNFMNNNENVNSSESINIWNSTEKIIYTYNGNTYEKYMGNYWSDYEEKYPDAEELDSTGIWDTPYSIDRNKDNYPLAMRFEYYRIE